MIFRKHLKLLAVIMIFATILSMIGPVLAAPGIPMYTPDGRSIVVSAKEIEAYKREGWYLDPVVTVYAPDGRSTIILKRELNTYLKSGWYADPVVTMYAPDGRSIIILQNEIEAYKNEGWYTDPVTTMYAPDGRSSIILQHEIEAYKDAGWYTDPVATMYAPDGRSTIILKSEVEAYKNVGWYTDPVVIMYTPDGRSSIILKYETEAYKNAGWYTEPVTMMYAPDGRTLVVTDPEVEAYKAVGWYTAPVTTLYALDGRTLVVPLSEAEAHKAVGWYDYIGFIIASSDIHVTNYGYNTAINTLEEYLDKQCTTYIDDPEAQKAIKQKSLSLQKQWYKKVGDPMVAVKWYITTNNYGIPVVILTHRNISDKTVVAFKTLFTCYDASGKVTTDYPSRYSGDYTGYANNENIEPGSEWIGALTLSDNRKTTSISWPYFTEVVFSDGTKWHR